MSTDILINDTLPKVQYLATGGQTTFAYNFPILVKTDLEVFRTPNGQQPDDAAQKLAVDSDYSVTGVGEESGGTVVMSIVISANDRITIQRAMPYQRLSSYRRGRQYNAESLDVDFNSIIMMMQQIHAYYEKRFLRYENTVKDDTTNFRLPTLANGQFWKHTGSGIAAVTLEENPNWSTLRSELASQNVGADGARLIGYQDAVIGNTTMHGAIQAYQGMYGNDVGVINHIIIEVDSFVGYREGMRVLAKVAYDNANDDVTLNINYTGQKNVRLQSNEGLPASSIIAGMIAEFIYDGEKFIIMNPFESHSDFRTGDVKITTHHDAEPGWVWMNDETIGSANSNATRLKSDTAKALFIHLWNQFDQGLAPVIEGRGANAEADWLANKQIQLLRSAGRAVAVAGSGAGLTARFVAQVFGEENHQLTQSELAAHQHSSMNFARIITLSGVARSIPGDGPGSGEFPPIADSGNNLTAGAGSNIAHNNIQPTVWFNFFMKL